MDPDELLRLIRLTIKQMTVDEHPGIYKAHAQELAGYVTALDDQLSNDGNLPSDWVAEEDKPRCTVEHGDWTGAHVRISSCPEPGYDPHGGAKHRVYEEN
jgi:hypothetical protein